ncbi:SusC/RagA family TonB-linked outer membrane protein [Deminuibacter soli]|nr:SusC/RagA family TonB-linked outer membrane protein [Deminuibacter soli]
MNLQLSQRFRAPLLTVIALFMFSVVFAQSFQLKGKITDATSKNPVAGATIASRVSGKSVATGNDGAFSIPSAKGDALTISYVGYDVKLVDVTGDAFLDLEINASSKQLSEVVVTAFGIKKETRKLGYAVQEIKGEDLVKARDQNPVTGLTGKIAGLSVGPSAELLRKPTVILRGNEISLYVVDGVPISSDTWNISPDDVETYTVLKGPTAAALYGARAQYGAILITTKKGLKKKGFTVELNSTNSFDKGFIAFPRTQDEYGPGENELYAFGDGKGGGLNDNDYDVWGPKFNGQLIPQYDGKYDPNTTFTTTFPGGKVWTGHIQPTPFIARGKDNLKHFLRTGFQTTDNISLSTSGDNYNLRFSLSHSYQQSIIPNEQLNITNFNMYGSYNPSSRLKVEGSLNYNRQYTPNFPDVDYGPNSLIYNMAVWTGADWDVNAPDIKGIWQPGKVGTQSVFAEYQRYHNPWFMVKEWTRGHYKNDIFGYVAATYKIDNHLNLLARTQITTYDLLRNEKMPYSAHPYGREQNQGDYREDRRSLFENNTDLQLNFNYRVGDFLGLSGLVGGTGRFFNYNSSFTSTDYLSVPGVYSFSNSLNPVQASSFASDMRVYSGYASLDAALGKYANIGFTSRWDKSSAAPIGYQSFFYPSVSVSTVISDYVKLPEAISLLKLRASYANVRADATSAEVGTAPFSTISALGGSPSGHSITDYPLGYGNNYLSPYGGPNYALIAAYSVNKNYNNQPSASYTNNIYNANIKTATRVNYEEGFDIRFLKNRLGLSATAFQYVDGPQILQNTISSSTGYGYYYLNALKTKKTGYEVSLQGTPVKTRTGFNWDVLVNWSTFREKYDELPPGQQLYNTFYKKGDRVDKFYGTAFVRTQDGKIINDNAGKPLTDSRAAQFLGYLNADYAWSIYNKLSYRGLSMGFQFDGSVGGKMVDYMRNKTMRGGRNIETAEGALGAARSADNDHAGDANYKGVYVGEGVVLTSGQINYNSTTGAIDNYKDLTFAPNKNVATVQDYVSKYYGIDESNLMSKSYAKLREVTIGYDLPAKWLNRTFMSKVTVSLVGRNLIYFYGDKRFKDVDLDQYNGPTSLSVLQSPTTRRYGINLNVVF